MARPKDLGLEHTWRLRLRRQATSDLSIPDFCRREGVSTASFDAWRRRLTRRRSPPYPTRPCSSRSASIPRHPRLTHRRPSASRSSCPIASASAAPPLPIRSGWAGSSPPWPAPRRGRTSDDLTPLRRPCVLLHPIGRYEEDSTASRASSRSASARTSSTAISSSSSTGAGIASRPSISIMTAWPSGTNGSRSAASRCPTPAIATASSWTRATGHDPLRHRPEGGALLAVPDRGLHPPEKPGRFIRKRFA